MDFFVGDFFETNSTIAQTSTSICQTVSNDDNDTKKLSTRISKPTDNQSLTEDSIQECNTEVTGDVDRKPAALPSNLRVNCGVHGNQRQPMVVDECAYYHETESDRFLAQVLQQQEEVSFEFVKRHEMLQMQSTPTGRAWQFVEQVVALVDQLKNFQECPNMAPSMVQPVSIDDMVFTTERLLRAQERFRATGKPATVDLRYHYPRAENMSSIQTDGLLSKKEQIENETSAEQEQGLKYGDGIFSASNPSVFHRDIQGKRNFGDVGLLVARLLGTNTDLTTRVSRENKNEWSTDSATVFRDTAKEIVALSTSQQCIPILQFSASVLIPFAIDNPGNVIVFNFHNELQGLIDRMLNNNDITVLSQYQNLTGPNVPLTTLCSIRAKKRCGRAAARTSSRVSRFAASSSSIHPFVFHVPSYPSPFRQN